MNILAMDTSNQVLSIAVLHNEQIIGEVVTHLNKNHSTRLMPAINQLMSEVAMKPEELDKIAVAKGPGSYTGVRIGLTTAKTMAWALNIPIVAVSSLEVLAASGRLFTGPICSFFDARRGLVFSGGYEWNGETLETVGEDENILMDTVLKKVKERGEKTLFLSPDIEKFTEEIREQLGELAVIPKYVYHVPRASHLGLLSLNREPDDLHTLTPSYLRLAEAEANWLKAQKGQENND